MPKRWRSRKRRNKEKTSDEQFHERSDESDFRSLRRILPVHVVPAGAGKKLFENAILLPKDRKPEDCFDEDAYIRIIRPKLGILGLVIFLFGVFSAINDRCDPPLLEFPLIFIPWGVEAAVLIWYAVSSSRAMKDYF